MDKRQSCHCTSGSAQAYDFLRSSPLLDVALGSVRTQVWPVICESLFEISQCLHVRVGSAKLIPRPQFKAQFVAERRATGPVLAREVQVKYMGRGLIGFAAIWTREMRIAT